MTEHNGTVTFKGAPLTLVGKSLKQGDAAPDAEVLTNDLQPVKLSSYKGKTCVICSVPSLDTPVCDLETKRFNQEAEKLGSNVKILTISMDLPFAQKRWCGAAHATNVITLSDHRDASFGKAYGVLIKEWRLLSRAVFIVDKMGIIQNVHYLKEISEQPNYDLILQELHRTLSNH